MNLRAEVEPQSILNAPHNSRKLRTGISAARVDERDRENLASQILQREALAVLFSERKFRRRFDLRQSVSHCCARCKQDGVQKHNAGNNPCIWFPFYHLTPET